MYLFLYILFFVKHFELYDIWWYKVKIFWLFCVPSSISQPSFLFSSSFVVMYLCLLHMPTQLFAYFSSQCDSSTDSQHFHLMWSSMLNTAQFLSHHLSFTGITSVI